MALGGRRFININNNQMEDGVDVKGCVGEEARPGQNVWGGRLFYVMRNFGTYFTGTYVFLLVPHESAFLHDSVRYQNIRSRDPITLLSMDILVETFLEIGVSDILVLT